MSNEKTLVGLAGEDFWAQYEAIMGPEGLMTYRYIGSRGAVAHDPHHAESTAVVRSDMRGPAGILAAALEIMGGDCLSILDDAIAIPAPVNCSLGVVDRGDEVAEARVQGRIDHAGRSQMFTAFVVSDAADPSRVLAVGSNLSVVIGPAPEGARYVPPGPGMADDGSLPRLWEAFGARRRDDGRYEIPGLTPHLGSTSASLHHGPTQVILEAAATDAALAAAGGDTLSIAHWNVSFTARGTVGPFVTSVDVVGAAGPNIGCEARLVDEGTGRQIATAAAVFRRD